jgi:hypothetical protein
MELLQLRKRVEDLQDELRKARTSAPKGTEGLAQGEEAHSVRFTFRSKDDDYFAYTTWNSNFSPSWNTIFGAVAPLMIDESSDPTLKAALNSMIADANSARIQSIPKLKGLPISNFSIKDEDFQTIKVQLRALGLITKSITNRSVKDSGTYWTLTPYGDDAMTQLRAIKRNNDLVTDEDVSESAENEAAQ